jgi:hypothetical protein
MALIAKADPDGNFCQAELTVAQQSLSLFYPPLQNVLMG